MKTDVQSLLLLLGGAGFAAFFLVKLMVGLSGRGDGFDEARRRVLQVKRRAGDRSLSGTERAALLREAAGLALEGMGRPSLAAALARRAEKLDPGNPDAVGLVAMALRRGARYSALERLLWQRMADQDGPATPGFERSFEELLALYEGPLHRPETAKVLRRFRAAAR
jgi:hypothetical protein